ncbi:MAG: exonuclease SbcCD subunit D, partial [Anaerolineae bacterium]|nr:exonuclease SbcCD subunit D [Anaerolineae bacterium]
EEKERKGFVMAQVERGHSSWEFIPVEARRFVTIRLDVTAAEDPLTQVLDELSEHRVDGAVVRVIIKATEAQEMLLDDKTIRQALREASYIASIVPDVERVQHRRLAGVATEELTPKEALELYLDSKETPAERKAELLRHAEVIFRED